eukprot:gene22863-biopygen13327
MTIPLPWVRGRDASLLRERSKPRSGRIQGPGLGPSEARSGPSLLHPEPGVLLHEPWAESALLVALGQQHRGGVPPVSMGLSEGEGGGREGEWTQLRNPEPDKPPVRIPAPQAALRSHFAAPRAHLPALRSHFAALNSGSTVAQLLRTQQWLNGSQWGSTVTQEWFNSGRSAGTPNAQPGHKKQINAAGVVYIEVPTPRPPLGGIKDYTPLASSYTTAYFDDERGHHTTRTNPGVHGQYRGNFGGNTVESSAVTPKRKIAMQLQAVQ